MSTDLLLGVGPARNLNNHVEDGLLVVGVEWDIVERRAWLAVLLNVGAVLESVRSSDAADAVYWGHV